MNEPSRILVNLIFFYTCVEGLIINVWHPSKLPFLYKDLAILALYVLVFLPSLAKLFAPSPIVKPLALPLLFFSGVVGFYLLLPGMGLLAGLLAVKQKLFYIPWISVGYLFVRSPDALRRFFLFLMVCGIGVAAFGIYLYFTGPQALVKLGAGYSAVLWTPRYDSTVQQYWRVPGTFTSSGQYGAYLLFHGLVTTTLLIDGSLSKSWKHIAAVSLIVTVLAMLASGTRAPLLLLSVSGALLVLLSRKFKGAIAWGMIGYVLVAFGFLLLGQGVEDRLASIATYEHVKRFQTTYFGQLFLPALLENPAGSGLGVATIGARHVSGSYEIQLVESYFGILALETGVLGVISFLWVALAIAALLLQARKDIDAMPRNSLCQALAIYVLLILVTLPVGTAIDHAPTNLYFWFSIGVLCKLADLQRERGAVTGKGTKLTELSSRATYSAGRPSWMPQFR